MREIPPTEPRARYFVSWQWLWPTFWGLVIIGMGFLVGQWIEWIGWAVGLLALWVVDGYQALAISRIERVRGVLASSMALFAPMLQWVGGPGWMPVMVAVLAVGLPSFDWAEYRWKKQLCADYMAAKAAAGK